MTTAVAVHVFILRCVSEGCRKPRDRIVPEPDARGQQTHFFRCKSCGHYNVVRLEIREGCVLVLN